MGIEEYNEGPELVGCPVCRTGVQSTVGFGVPVGLGGGVVTDVPVGAA